MKKSKVLNMLLVSSLTLVSPMVNMSTAFASSNQNIDLVSSSTSLQKTLVATYQVPVASIKSGAPIEAVNKGLSKVFGESILVKEYSDGSLEATVHSQEISITIGQTYLVNILSLGYYQNGKVVSVEPTSLRQVNTTNGTIEVPDEMTFPLIKSDDGNYRLQIVETFMNRALDISLALDFKSKVEIVDQTLLTQKIQEAQTYYDKNYTKESLDALKEVVENASLVLNQTDVTQAKINEQITLITQAIASLQELSTSIKDGEYEVEAKIMKANSTTETSMANNALKSAKLVVENQKTTVLLNLQEMNMYGISASVERLAYKGLDGKYYDALITQTDEQKGYPTQFQFELPQNVEYTDVKFYYLGNSGSQARLYLNLSELIQVQKVDKTTLASLIEQTNQYSKDQYTLESYENLQSVLIKAKEVYDNENATQVEVDQQVNLLKEAISLLNEKALSKIEMLKVDGVYELPIYLWNASLDQASMAANALKSKAIIKVENGKKTMTIYTQKMTLGTIEAYLQELKVFDENSQQVDVKISSRDENNNPKSFTFELPHTNEYIDVLVNPRVALMGNQDIAARLKLDYTQLKVYSGNEIEDTSTSQNNSTNEKVNLNNNAQDHTTLPQTGDDSNAFMVFMMMIFSSMVAVVLKRQKKEV